MRIIGRHVTPPATTLSTSLFAAPLLEWLRGILLVVLIASLASAAVVQAQTPGQIKALRKEAEDLFYHGFENYMTYAFPEDELRPISCKPLTRDSDNPTHIEVNDPLGNYSLTLIDSLSTLAILASNPSNPRQNKPLRLFQDGVRDLVAQYGDGSDGWAGEGLRARGFDLDSKVQVFETAIRGLGGLLSAHLFAVGDLPIKGYHPPQEQLAYAQAWHKDQYHGKKQGILWPNAFEYDGQLLRLAHDLGSRLLPAFWSSTGIPYPRVNLRHGIPFYVNSPLNVGNEDGKCPAPSGAHEITETCSAGAGSLVLEFTVLSRLTGDPRFEELAKRAFWAIWQRRSSIDLIGGGIDAESGNWIGTWTGIGAGIDSFFEYALKSHILLSREAHPIYDRVDEAGDPRLLHDPISPEAETPQAFLNAWNTAHSAIKRHLYRDTTYQHPHYIQADLVTGAARGFWLDALSAYYPGLLTLAGEVEEAIETHLLQTALWTRFSALPERWNLVTGGIEGGLGWWVGRPEFIESTYYLYRVTQDPWYFHVGEMVLRDIKRRCWTRCGWASIQNVLTGEQTDRMESFFLGETAKYLFLLFDPAHPLNHLDEPFVFTTEGHPLVIPRSVGHDSRQESVRRPRQEEESFCPVGSPPLPFTLSNVAARGDVYHAANLARLHLMPHRDNIESVLGEYAADHPSITLSDISSPSNYTYYPWTLPPQLVRWNATSSVIPTRPTLDISFPAMPAPGVNAPPLQRVKDGILINAIGGLRLGLVQDAPWLSEDGFHDAWRIQTINNIPLGKDEKIYLGRETGQDVLSPADPNFTRLKDHVMLDLVVDLNSPIEEPDTPAEVDPAQDDHDQAGLIIEVPVLSDASNDNAMRAAWNAIVSQISSLIKDSRPASTWPFPTPLSLTVPTKRAVTSSSSTSTSPPDHSQGQPRYHLSAVTATGPGAAPLPSWPEVPNFVPLNSASPPSLPWTKIYATDELCDHKIPLSVVRTHQVLVLKRGGCDWSDKLQNIPAFTPASGALQVVVVVNYGHSRGQEDEGDDGDEADLVRPYLPRQQTTPAGLVRRNPIPMVLVGGGDKVYDALKERAVGVGIKRRYHVETKAVRIANLVIV
ncbi:mannosyl-oligosaccharide alpha-1,2-mannosidase [Cladophialophora yegresii CBS 114405]|uniref:alpha-1,2-Mannosidase n=1 Tax=Cladophialophora yegresii CBS 114405 TaxID=1182544 RepID=W9W0A4_9EURO|nr:mannosyl-oligosaccharide alpha-1,2-mannosidase [Cladophialophora yegresii CBS 114405]EXJ57931.1 mannosyl-oligosaccharide alpha-1,2-mannosidase [Cladophialophora yegresii CBS 114405]